MGYQAGYLKLDQIIDTREFTFANKIKSKGKVSLERILERPEETLFQYFIRLFVMKRFIITVELVDKGKLSDEKPKVLEINRSPENSLGYLDRMMYSSMMIFCSEQVLFTNLVLMQEEINARLP